MIRRRLGQARRWARRAARVVRGPRQVPARVSARRRSGQDFAARVAAAPAPVDGPHRSWDAFAARLAACRGIGLTGRLSAAGLRPWTVQDPGLTASCLAAAQEALVAGDLGRATLLADALVAARPRDGKALRLAAEVAAADGRDRAAHQLRLRASRWSGPRGEQDADAADRRWARRQVALDHLHALRTDGVTGPLDDLLPPAATGRTGSGLDDVVLALVQDRLARGVGADGAGGEDRSPDDGPAAGGDLLPLYEPAGALAGRARPLTLAPTELAATSRTISLAGLRRMVTGKRVALIANAAGLIGSGLGETIDGYDLVVRFNSFALDPEHTGARTDVHVSFHKYDFNNEVHVPVRIVISAKRDLWEQSLRTRVRPGAQDLLGDETLRWPAVTTGLIGPDDPFRLPTAGFQLTRVLVDMGVCAAVDLIGFDFYGTGKHRVAGAMSIPHSAGHDSAAERDWVMAHAAQVGTQGGAPVISMGGPEQ